MAKLSDLHPDASNANNGTERGRQALETSLRKYGAGRSILLDKHMRIIAGNKTAEVAGELGIDDVVIVQTDGTKIVAVQRTDLDIDSPEGRGLAYADNRVGELSLDWDAERMFADITAGVQLDDLWRADELDELLADLRPKVEGDTEPEIDRAEELRQKWGVQPGQLWQLGEHRLICGDCTDAATVARVMGGERAEITFTSPPYNLGENVKLSTRNKTQNAYRDGYQDNKTSDDYLTLLLSFLDAAMSVSEYQFVNMQMLAGNKITLWEFAYSQRSHIADVAIWSKSNPQPAAAKKVMNSAFEFIFIFASEPEPSRAIATANFHGTFSNVYAGTVNSENIAPELHSAAFPLSLCSDFIAAFTSDNATVFEPFDGTGTTIIACENLSRRCRAVEISPGYVAVALERWHIHTGKTPVLVE